ncbi:10372_t:CDS:2 [Paraglomus brasilianum]|uniref:Superoxide dismutase n=1 Tax=Paraglomus brasilianum TaxID=144538 RepID=A0A9N9A7G7_9GLOM|nr:10372_t:CDS:2 [Paraglomus brasilianum]
MTTRAKHSVPDLPYDYNALEPAISAEIMKVHHDKHHAAYVSGLNVAEEKYDQALRDGDLTSQIALQSAIKFNGGGHINHSLFWENLAPVSRGGGEPPKGALLSAIQKEFGSLEDFISKFNTTTAAVQGSGWGWLGYNKSSKRIEIVTLPNQDPLTTHVPLLGVDVWEHVYNSVLTVLSRAISDSSNTTFLLGLGILPAIQKRAARLSQSNLVCGQLEDRRRKVCKGTMTGIIIHNKGTKALNKRQ